MQRILLIGSYAPSLVNFRGPLIQALISGGVSVHVTAPDVDANTRLQLEHFGATVHDVRLQRTRLNPLSDLNYGLRLRKLIQQIKADTVLTYTIKPNIWGAFAAYSCGVPSVAMVTGLGYAFTNGTAANLRQRIVRRIAQFLYRQATNRNQLVVFQNPDDRDDFIQAGCLIDPTKVRMVNGSGVDMDHYGRTPLPDTPVFLMISRLLKNKGVREYAQAAIATKSKYPDAKFQLVGYFDEGPDGIDRATLDSWIAQGVDYMGPKSDVRPALSQARIYVLPSYREGTPRSVLEAMSMGRAIISTDVPGCRETVRDLETGLLVPKQDAKALQAAMEYMIEHPTICDDMADKSYDMACAKYDVHKVNETLIGYLTS